MVTILSFPRSGNHFVRYIIEFLTGKATMGAAGFTKVKGQDTPICLRSGPKFLTHVSLENRVAHKAHFANEAKIIDGSKLVLILRHPMESILSHRYNELSFIRTGNKISNKELNIINEDMLNFIENLNYYESFNGVKEVVLYEDLIGDSYVRSIECLDKIFDFDKNMLNDFIENFQKYRIDSMKSPIRKPISISRTGSEDFYANKIKSININNFETFCDTISEVLNHKIIKEYYG